MEHKDKISVNVSVYDKLELQKIAARRTLEGKETTTSDVVRKFIKLGIKGDWINCTPKENVS